jgi:hypothetical protein
VEADVIATLRQGPNVSWLQDIQRRAEKVAGELIETVRGFGYRMQSPQSRSA